MSLFASSAWRSSGWLWGSGLVLVVPFACTPGERAFAPSDMGGADGSGAASVGDDGNPSGGASSGGGSGPTGGDGPTGGNSSGGNDSTGGSGTGGGSGGGGSTTGPCEDHACEHGSACFPDGDDDYTCDCSGTGYTGDFCQTEIDECDPNPCQQGAECTDLVGDYTCACSDQFAGKNCELLAFELVPTDFAVAGLSPDGLVLVGKTSYPRAASYKNGVMTDLGTYIGDMRSEAYSASNGGEVIVGKSEWVPQTGTSTLRAVVWEAGGVVQLPAPLDFPRCVADSVTPDGNVISGSCTDAAAANQIIVRWVDRELDELGNPSDLDWCYGTVISGDGQSVFGQCSVTSYRQPMRWTEADGSVLLSAPNYNCAIGAVMPDGLRGAGTCAPGGSSAYGHVWTLETGVQILSGSQLLDPDDTLTTVNDMSTDGRFLVGGSGYPGNVPGVLWEENEPVLLEDFLAAEGVDLTNWTFMNGQLLSANGMVMVGAGTLESSGRTWILRRE